MGVGSPKRGSSSNKEAALDLTMGTPGFVRGGLAIAAGAGAGVVVGTFAMGLVEVVVVVVAVAVVVGAVVVVLLVGAAAEEEEEEEVAGGCRAVDAVLFGCALCRGSAVGGGGCDCCCCGFGGGACGEGGGSAVTVFLKTGLLVSFTSHISQ